MKGKILQILRDRPVVVSGEAIRADLGISRVSVWKHIRKLQELGYPIASTGKGYRLTDDFDALFPWEFPGREDRIRFVAEATSTMDIARDLARKGWPDRGMVVAQTQSAGRGRLKRHWLSDAGGLFFTLIFRPTIPPVLSYRYLFAASLVLARTLTALYDIPARVKWPNDVLVDGKKISGMLAEMEAEADLVTFLNVGIGINVNNDPTDREAGATSVQRLIGRPVNRRDLLTAFLDRLEARLDQDDLVGIVAEWTANTVTLNRPVRIVTGRDTTEGTAVDVDENGALKVKLSDGSVKTVIYGDCFHI
jgi:BirA family transcriptional regulator, biotin operon repressor / biotin---[acetyl-CoA-carboxylase] ligase